MKNSLKIERLIELRDKVLKKTPVKKFNLRTWFNPYYRAVPLQIKIPKEFVQFNCKSSACALGMAGLYKPFRKLGLKTHQIKRSVTYINPETGLPESGMEAAMGFFGLSQGETHNLFAPGMYYEILKEEGRSRDSNAIKPRHVITKIDKLLDTL